MSSNAARYNAVLGRASLWGAALPLEKLLGYQTQGKDEANGVGSLSLEFVDVADLPLVGADMERCLVRYVEESVRLSRTHTVVGLVIDKTNLPGVTVQNTCLILPTSRAIVCCPAVRWGVAAGKGWRLGVRSG